MKKTFKTSDELKKELIDIEVQIKELTNISNDLKVKLIAYLDKRRPDEFTAALYNNAKFAPRVLHIHSDKLLLLTRKQEEVKTEYINRLREELIQGFVIEHPEFKTEFKEVVVENSVSGVIARVMIK
jgi:hypothetical protein